jgi:DNA-binding transcriptional LysR family regulator
VRAALDTACAEAGFTPRIVFEASALAMAVHLAALGLGLAVVPASTADTPAAQAATPARPPAPRIIPITNPQIRSRLELAWNSTPPANPAARVLIEHAKSFIRPPAPPPPPATGS